MSDFEFYLPDEVGFQKIKLKDGENKGDVIIEMQSMEDVAPVLDNIRKQRNEKGRQTLGHGTQASQFKLGELSMLKAHQLMQQEIFWDDKKLRSWFWDLDNYLWRVTGRSNKYFGGVDAVQDTQGGKGPQEHNMRVHDS